MNGIFLFKWCFHITKFLGSESDQTLNNISFWPPLMATFKNFCSERKLNGCMMCNVIWSLENRNKEVWLKHIKPTCWAQSKAHFNQERHNLWLLWVLDQVHRPQSSPGLHLSSNCACVDSCELTTGLQVVTGPCLHGAHCKMRTLVYP